MNIICSNMCNDQSCEKLYEIDLIEAQNIKEAGCPYCGGNLHKANYLRKPRGNDLKCTDKYEERLSFCCGKCRRRTTPKSCRFLGRKVYCSWSIVCSEIVKNSLMASDILISSVIGASVRTISRWRSWWQNKVGQSAIWYHLRVHITPTVDTTRLVSELAQRFNITWQQPNNSITKLLNFLSPLSIRSNYPA